MKIKLVEDKVYYIQHKGIEDLIIIDDENKTISIKPNIEYKLFAVIGGMKK